MNCEVIANQTKHNRGLIDEFLRQISEEDTGKAYTALFKYNEVEFKSDYKNIYILQFGRLGESLWALPVVRNICRKFKEAKVTFIVSEMIYELLSDYTNEFDLIKFPFNSLASLYQESDQAAEEALCKEIGQIRIEQDSLLINLGRNRASFLYTGILKETYNSSVIGISEDEGGNTLIWGNRYTLLSALASTQKINTKHEIDVLFRKIGLETDEVDIFMKKRPYENRNNTCINIAIAIGASNPIRMWNTEAYKELSIKLIDLYGADIYFFGTEKEKSYLGDMGSFNGKMNVLCGIPLKEQVNYLKKCNILICSDSGMLHLATALEVRTVVVSGPTLPFITGAYAGNSVTVMLEAECVPCYQTSCDSNKCIKNISVEDMLAATEYMLEEKAIHLNNDKLLFYQNNDKKFSGYQAIAEQNVSSKRIATYIINFCVSNILGDGILQPEEFAKKILGEVQKIYCFDYDIDKITDIFGEYIRYLGTLDCICDEYLPNISDEEDEDCDIIRLANEFGSMVYVQPYYIRAMLEFNMIYNNMSQVNKMSQYYGYINSIKQAGGCVKETLEYLKKNLLDIKDTMHTTKEIV